MSRSPSPEGQTGKERVYKTSLTTKSHSRKYDTKSIIFALIVFSLRIGVLLLLGVSPGVSDYASAVFCCDAASWEA